MKHDVSEYGLSVYVQTITPKTAKDMIACHANPKNRKVSDANVANYSRMMKNGDWMLNGEAIVIQSDGIIANGHNRLESVARAGVPVDFLVVDGVSPEAFATYDGGQARTAAHVLHMEDVPNATNVAATISAVMIYRGAVKRDGSFNTYVRPTNMEILAEYNSNPQLYQVAHRLAARTKSICPITPASMLYSYLLIDLGYDYEKLDFFCGSLASGEMLRRGNPILTLRNTLMIAKSEKQNTSSSGRSANWYKNACIIAWNAYTENRELKLIKIIDANKAIKIK